MKRTNHFYKRIGPKGKPIRDDSHAVYRGDAEEVAQGFVIALRAMGIEPDIPEGALTRSVVDPVKEGEHDA
jgi:hypothetical protein